MFGGTYQGRRVLLTGHTGFKGAWLSLWLKQLGAEVTGYALSPTQQQNNFVHGNLSRFLKADIRGDVRDLEHVRTVVEQYQPEVVFHLAAQPLVRHSYQDPVYTFDVNVRGTANVLEAIRLAKRPCRVIVVTSDKCYENREMDYAYREDDPMGGHDPYSASKGCEELVAAAYRASFFAQDGNILLASARAGNVIGPGDWAENRIVPDAVRAVSSGHVLPVRSPKAIRPWQHVLEPLCGYLRLGQALEEEGAAVAEGWNFGPDPTGKYTVEELVDLFCQEWGGGAVWAATPDSEKLHEAHLLQLSIEKAAARLRWHPTWDFDTTVRRTARGYRRLLAATGSDDVCSFMKEEIAAYEAARKGN